MGKAGQKVGTYVLVEKIGQGGFGEVWKARHSELDEIVAIKIPTSPEYLEELRTGGRLQHALRHPGIVRTLGLDLGADPPYFVMEFVSGGNLRDRLRLGPIPFRESLDIARQLLEALDYAHSQGVVHRDLKPENVLWSEGPRRIAKITDFGLGRVVESVTSRLLISGRTGTTEIAGTLDYMAPEQRRGSPADVRSDVYSFGVLFYELLVGELPIGAFRYPSEVFPDLPVKIDEFVRRCLAPVPADRFAHAGEARAALGEAEDHSVADVGRGEGLALPMWGEVFTVRELVETMLERPDDARRLVNDPKLETWLRQVRERDLARIAAELRATESDPDIAVQKLVEASGMVPPPRLELDALELSLGAIPHGSSRTFSLRATRIGKGTLYGEARIEGDPEWVQPARLFFKGVDNALDFTISTAQLRPGERREVRVRIESNGGAIHVEVRFEVASRPAKLVCVTPVLDVECRGKTGLGKIVVRNSGEESLALSASWEGDWIQVDRVRDIPPGSEAEVEVRVDSRKLGDEHRVSRVTLDSNGGSCEVIVRAVRVRWLGLF